MPNESIAPKYTPINTQRRINGYSINVFLAGGGYRIIVTKPDGSKVFDFAFDERMAWQIARGHAHIPQDAPEWPPKPF